MNSTMAIYTYLSTIALNANGLNTSNERHIVTEWITKQDLYVCCLQEAHFRSKGTHRPKVKEWKKIFLKSGYKTRAGVAILLPDKIDFKTKAILREKEGSHNSTSGYLPKETKNNKSKIYMHLYVYCSIIYNGQVMEAV